jgi:4-hydroxy-tetrahydrodipicolinate synthase
MLMKSDLDLAGLVSAVVTPMRSDGEVDDDALRRYIRWLLSFDRLKALAVNMDTGEGPALSRLERRRVLEIYVDQTSGRIPVLAGIGAPSTAGAVQIALDARDAGASGLVVFPHPVFVGEPLPPEVPYEYHCAIADASGLPIVLFQLQPALAGVIFSKETLLKLVSIPNVVAIKEASFDAVRFVETVRILSEAPRRIQVLTGNDNFILESFLLGADGALIGFGTLAIAEQLEMMARLRDGDVKSAREVYDEVIQPLVSVIFAPPVRNYRARVKEALVAMGVLEEAHVRPPLLPLERGEKRAVREAVARARLKSPAGAPS